MLKKLGVRSAAAMALICAACASCAQLPATKQPDSGSVYTLRLPVDEVVLTFNAMDVNGLPINDLKIGEIRLRDNGVAPRRIVAFDELRDRHIRVGILLDTSGSMGSELTANKAIVRAFAQRLFRQKADAGFVAAFANSSEILEDWTGDAGRLLQGAERAAGNPNSFSGTALFNAVFRACAYSFDKVDPTATGNFILLFSDGEDNAGLTSMEEAARACQRSNTQVFAFLPATTLDQASTGPKTLRDLAAKTGGHVFVRTGSDEAMEIDLRLIESQMRNVYRLAYKPANLLHDGAFHEIDLQPPDRVSRVEMRSGYFAPSR